MWQGKECPLTWAMILLYRRENGKRKMETILMGEFSAPSTSGCTSPSHMYLYIPNLNFWHKTLVKFIPGASLTLAWPGKGLYSTSPALTWEILVSGNSTSFLSLGSRRSSRALIVLFAPIQIWSMKATQRQDSSNILDNHFMMLHLSIEL